MRPYRLRFLLGPPFPAFHLLRARHARAKERAVPGDRAQSNRGRRFLLVARQEMEADRRTVAHVSSQTHQSFVVRSAGTAVAGAIDAALDLGSSRSRRADLSAPPTCPRLCVALVIRGTAPSRRCLSCNAQCRRIPSTLRSAEWTRMYAADVSRECRARRRIVSIVSGGSNRTNSGRIRGVARGPKVERNPLGPSDRNHRRKERRPHN